MLSYHRTSLFAIAFASLPLKNESAATSTVEGLEEEESEDSEEEGNYLVKVGGGKRRINWLAVGGKDERISLWDVYPSE